MLDKTKNYVSSVGDTTAQCRTCRISELCILRGLTEDELASLDIAERHMERNDVLYHAGEKSRKIFAVKTGSYKTLIANSEGNEQVTGFYLPGEIIGLDGLGGRVHDSRAISLEVSTVCEIREAEFNKLCETNHELNQSFLRILGKEISGKQQQVMLLGQMRGIARLAIFVVNQSSYSQKRGFSSTEFSLNMPRHDIASYLGLAVETLSREFKQLQDQGYLEVKRHNIKILNMEGLCELSSMARCTRKLSD